MTIGIYKIENLVNRKVYIGQSINVEKRLQKHEIELRNNYHYNNHLQRAWNKYGSDNFTIELIEECSKELLTDKEKHWIDHYSSLDLSCGYNKREASSSGSFPQEVRDKMSASKVGKYCGKDSPSYGRPVSLETRIKISESLKGRFGGELHPMFGTEGKRGENNVSAKITEVDAKKIIDMLINHKSRKEILLSVPDATIAIIKQIRARTTWKYLTTESTFKKVI